MSIWMKNYKICNDSDLSLDEVKSIVETMDRGLWDTDHGVLRDNVSSLRHDLVTVTELSDSLHERMVETVKRFNALDSSTLNKKLLNDKGLPKGSEPKPTPPGKKPEEKAASNPDSSVQALEERLGKLEERINGHDRRHEEAETNLKALNGAMGIVKNGEGTWLPTPDGQFDRNAKVQEHLGYSRDKDGKVSFADRASSVQFNSKMGGLIGLGVTIVALTIFLITGATFTVALFWSIMIGLGVLAISGFIAAPRNNN